MMHCRPSTHRAPAAAAVWAPATSETGRGTALSSAGPLKQILSLEPISSIPVLIYIGVMPMLRLSKLTDYGTVAMAHIELA
jgi:hypothetical protein